MSYIVLVSCNSQITFSFYNQQLFTTVAALCSKDAQCIIGNQKEETHLTSDISAPWQLQHAALTPLLNLSPTQKVLPDLLQKQ